VLGAGQHTEALGTTHGAAVVAMITGLDELRKPKHKQLFSASFGSAQGTLRGGRSIE